ncbi:MAG: N-acetylneuraminate synthase family protein, partial [Candidatus Doudnabacteria bacterium]|nr:N-acetylneuraminate synthase family protein [Candidatus Doudnabacteria bacterium]
EVAALGKPMMVSTGMSTYEEIDLTVAAIKQKNIPFSLAHCISSYPPKSLSELHLGVIRELGARYDTVVGFSDHTPPEGLVIEGGKPISEEAILFGAMGAGARYLEKHFTVDRKGKDADSWFSHDPQTLKDLINTAAELDKAMDNKREVFEEEKGVWIWAKRSLVAAEDIPAGAKITREMLKSKRPGTGIRSKDYHSILGKIVKHNIAKDKILLLTDLE